jgi:hypothetical protein
MLNNLFLLYAAMLVFVMVTGGIVAYPFDTTAKVLTYAAAILVAWLGGGFATARLQLAIRNSNHKSAWLQPASRYIRIVLLNAVAILLFCVMALLVGLLSIEQAVTTKLILWTAAIVSTVFFGRFIGRHIDRDSLLPYAIGSIAGLFVAVLTFGIVRLLSS